MRTLGNFLDSFGGQDLGGGGGVARPAALPVAAAPAAPPPMFKPLPRNIQNKLDKGIITPGQVPDALRQMKQNPADYGH